MKDWLLKLSWVFLAQPGRKGKTKKRVSPISFWMKTQTSSDDARFVVNKAIHHSSTATDDSYMMRIHNETGTPAMQIAGGGDNWIWIESSQVVIDGAWHHVAYVFDRPTSYFYIDGVYDESGIYPSFDYDLNNTAENVYLGSGFHESDGIIELKQDQNKKKMARIKC